MKGLARTLSSIVLIIFIALSALFFLFFTANRINAYRDQSNAIMHLIVSWNMVVNSLNEILLIDHNHASRIADWESACADFYRDVAAIAVAQTERRPSADLREILDEIVVFTTFIRVKTDEIDVIIDTLETSGVLETLGDKQIAFLSSRLDNRFPTDVQVSLWNLADTWLNFASASSLMTKKLEKLADLSNDEIKLRTAETYIVAGVIILFVFIVSLGFYLYFLRKNLRDEREKNRIRLYFTNLIDAMPSMVVGFDDTGIVRLWSREAARQTRMEPALCLGQPVAACLPFLTDTLPDIMEAIGHRGQKTYPALRGENGVVYELLAFPLQNNGRTDAILRIDNISERVRMENMMIQTEKILAVGGLAAGMAHEINNPLAGIIQNVQNLKRRLLDDSLAKNLETAAACGLAFPAIRSYLERRGLIDILELIADSADRASKIIQTTLKFTRKSDFELMPHQLSQLADTALELAGNDYILAKRYGFGKLAIVKEYSDQLPAVRCSDIEIEQVLLNLIVNAVQALKDVDPRSRDADYRPTIVVRVFAENDFVCCSVEDNGPGMSESVRKRVFEPFFTTKPPGSGTGLGLSVSYTIIANRHNGFLEVESRLEFGTKFTIRLRRG